MATHNALVSSTRDLLRLAYGPRAKFCRPQPGPLNQFHCDLYLCLDGLFCVFEIKTGTGRLTKAQREEFAALKEARGQCFEIRAIEDVERAIREKLPEPTQGVML